MAELVACLDHPALPLLQWNEAWSGAAARLPADLARACEVLVAEHEQQLVLMETLPEAVQLQLQQPGEFPAAALLQVGVGVMLGLA